MKDWFELAFNCRIVFSMGCLTCPTLRLHNCNLKRNHTSNRIMNWSSVNGWIIWLGMRLAVLATRCQMLRGVVAAHPTIVSTLRSPVDISTRSEYAHYSMNRWQRYADYPLFAKLQYSRDNWRRSLQDVSRWLASIVRISIINTFHSKIVATVNVQWNFSMNKKVLLKKVIIVVIICY